MITRAQVPGLLFAAATALVAVALVRLEVRLIGAPVIEPLVLALLLGVIARNLIPRPATLLPGASCAAKLLLEIGVALLGASVDLRVLLRSGPRLGLLVVSGVTLGLLFGYLIGRGLRLPARLAILVAVGNAICGNSAIAAVAPVIGAQKEDIASAIALTALLGVVLVLGLPPLIPIFSLSHYQYGVLAGMSVYAVPQVVAAAFPVSALSGEVATMVKLTRIMLLGPVVVFFALLYRKDVRQPGTGSPRGRLLSYVPWFVLVFFFLAAARSAGLLPQRVADLTREASRALTLLAMAGLGFGVELAVVRRVGPRVAVVVALSLLTLVGLTLLGLRLLLP